MAETFGSYLKQERTLRKISLEEISEHTLIKKEYLEAMESNHYEKLPGFTFVQGYLRAYANYIGLVPEEVLLRFEDYLTQLSGGQKDFSKRSSKWFWLIAFLGLSLVATVVLVWFRK